MTTDDERERLLNILNAHGRQFLGAFNAPKHEAKKDSDDSNSQSEEEWTGFGSSSNMGTFGTASDSEHVDQEQKSDASDEPVAGSLRKRNVTVFLESTRTRPEAGPSAKELRRLFMSSKVSNITSSSISKEKIPDEESDDERTNSQNDALLHRLVHTKLLSGSLDPELHLNHAQKGRALAGRVLELAGNAKLGKGESMYRQEHRNKAAKRVRDGLIRKQEEQDQKTLEEAKNLGNYHPTLKRLYDSSLSSAPKKKRARGLGMGVGKFARGTLKLSREEIISVTGAEKRLRPADKSRRVRQRR